LGLQERIEDLPIQELVAQLAIERFDVAVLPGTARFNVQRLHADPLQPITHCRRRELAAVVRAQIVRHGPLHEQVRE
jgi:hypothetical protein